MYLAPAPPHTIEGFADVLGQVGWEAPALEQLRECRLRLARTDALHRLHEGDARRRADVAKATHLQPGDTAAARSEAREGGQPIALLLDGLEQRLHAWVDEARLRDARQSRRVRAAMARDRTPE